MSLGILDVFFCPVFGLVTVEGIESRESSILVSLGRLLVSFLSEKGLDDSRCVLAKVIGIVATFLQDDDFWADL